MTDSLINKCSKQEEGIQEEKILRLINYSAGGQAVLYATEYQSTVNILYVHLYNVQCHNYVGEFANAPHTRTA